MRLLFIFHLFIILFLKYSLGLQCRDENNKPVDWYVLQKIPELHYSFLIPDVRKGRGYMYITSETLNDGWVISKNSVFDNSTAIAHTLAPYYKNNQAELWLLYNDQPPDRRTKGGGHTKGVIGGDKEGGFWLVHSVPHFPSLAPKYSYPSTGVKYGQSFFCISLSTPQLDSLGSNVLKYNAPHLYDKRINAELSIIYQKLAIAAGGDPVTAPPYFKKSEITSPGLSRFEIYAKAKQFNKDIYKWVADDLQVDVLSETWQNEEGPLPSDCNSPHKVLNINSISYKGIIFNSTHDHSKWAISTGSENPWVCIGDINRAKPQEKRGGGIVCISNDKLWQNYHDLTHDVEPCPKTSFESSDYYMYKVK